MVTLTEGRHPEEFLVSEANGQLSRDVVTAKSGNTFQAGEVFELDGDSKAVPFNNSTDLGAAGIMCRAVDASEGDVAGCPAIVRLAEVKEEALIVNGDDTDDSETKDHAVAALRLLNIIAR